MSDGEQVCWEAESIVFNDEYSTTSYSRRDGYDIIVFNGQYAQVSDDIEVHIIPWHRIITFAPRA